MLDFNKETWVILTFRMVTILVEVWLLYKIRLLLWNHGVAFHSWVMAPVHKATIPLKKNHLQKKKSLSAVKILPTQITWHLCNGGYRWKQLQKYQWKGTPRFPVPVSCRTVTNNRWATALSSQPLKTHKDLWPTSSSTAAPPLGKVSPLNLSKAPFVVVAPCLPLSSSVLAL